MQSRLISQERPVGSPIAEPRLSPFVFAAILSVAVLVAKLVTGSWDAGLPAFFCFLPIVFYGEFRRNVRVRLQIQDLQSRIVELEAAASRR